MDDNALSEDRAQVSSYAEATARIDEILAQLERNDRVDVDHLAARVAEASSLISFCRAKLRATEVEVTRVVTELAGGTTDGGAAASETGEAPAPAGDGAGGATDADEEAAGEELPF
jgi:exodeoxyribonuclease VII small subunit